MMFRFNRVESIFVYVLRKRVKFLKLFVVILEFKSFAIRLCFVIVVVVCQVCVTSGYWYLVERDSLYNIHALVCGFVL